MTKRISQGNARAILGDSLRVYRRKNPTTVIARVTERMECETIGGDVLPIYPGEYVALDEFGFPYPIAALVIEKSFDLVPPERVGSR